MRRSFCELLFLICLILQTSWAALATADELEVNVATLEYQPYVSAHLPDNGWAWEVCSTVFTNMGYKPKLHIYPWARALALVRNGKEDALYLTNINEERREWAVFSNPIGDEISVVFKRKDSPVDFTELSDLAEYEVAGLRGAHVVKVLERHGVEVYPVASLQQGFKLVFSGRLDMLVTDRLVGLHMLRTEMPAGYSEAIDFISTPVDSSQLHLAISRKRPDHKQLQEDFNLGLEQLRQSGAYSEILAKHGFLISD
ncbi:substrate-binding periplasmic protein [Kiloniella sp.]|uniref:substrate-binding periplasmic protein n=1 Tax=Kiloniella sp. TaxID=1938587 RepID=UPI003B01EA9E